MICTSCAHHCNISEGHTGICGRRRVVNGKLQIPYGAICSLALDPYEKKPLYHFHPGEFVLSFGNLGCNFKCAFCQNWDISQVGKDSQADGREQPVTPQQIVNLALALARKGKKVILLDMDLRNPSVGRQLGRLQRFRVKGIAGSSAAVDGRRQHRSEMLHGGRLQMARRQAASHSGHDQGVP